MRSRPVVVAAALTALLTAVVVAVALRPDGAVRASLPAVVDIAPAAVQRVVVEAGGRQAELHRQSGGWSALPGTPPPSAPLLGSSERQLFPLLAYRALPADPADPQYGLTEPAVVVRLSDGTGRDVGLRFGAASFSGAGFYAAHDSRPGRVYLVPRNTVDLLRSLVAGERTVSADPLRDQAGRYRAEREQAEQENSVPIYLRQVIDAGGEMPPAGSGPGMP